MKKIMLLTILILLCSYANAKKPQFHCYTEPGTPIQTFEFSSQMCQNDKNVSEDKNGMKSILCLQRAFCKPVTTDKDKKGPPEASTPELIKKIQAGELKPSLLVCEGKGKYKDGVLLKAECPLPTECQEDLNIHYNFNAPLMAPQVIERVTAPKYNTIKTPGVE